MKFRVWDAGQVRCRTGGLQDGRVAGNEGCRKDEMQERRES